MKLITGICPKDKKGSMRSMTKVIYKKYDAPSA